MVTKTDVYPLPIISENLSRLSGVSLFAALDLQSVYWQVLVKAVRSPKNHVYWVRRVVSVQSPCVWPYMGAFWLPKTGWSRVGRPKKDDPSGLSRRYFYLFERYRRACVSSSRRANLPTKGEVENQIEKCRFAETSLWVLGHIVSVAGIGPDPEKVKAVAGISWTAAWKAWFDEAEACTELCWPLLILPTVYSGLRGDCPPIVAAQQEGSAVSMGEGRARQLQRAENCHGGHGYARTPGLHTSSRRMWL